jgi:quinol monooxygenase YgiN
MALLAPVAVAAQEMAAPPWLSVIREVVKPGKGPAHAKHEVAWARALEAAKYPGSSLGLNSMSGPNENWWLTGVGSMAELEKLNAAYAASPALNAVDDKFVPPEADYLNNTFVMLARHRDDLSYSSGMPMSAMRYMAVTTITVRPGHGDEFVEARKTIKAAHEKSKAKDGFAVYQVSAGAATGTYLIFAAKASMAELDTNPHSPAYTAALGGPDGQKKLADMAGSYTGTSTANLFRVDPQISVLNKNWYDADPYWKPKAPAAPKKK